MYCKLRFDDGNFLVSYVCTGIPFVLQLFRGLSATLVRGNVPTYGSSIEVNMSVLPSESDAIDRHSSQTSLIVNNVEKKRMIVDTSEA